VFVADLFNEVEEEVRREKATAFVNKYGAYIVGALVLVLASVAAWQFYRGYSERQAQARTERFEAAARLAESGDFTQALAAFEALRAESPARFAPLVDMQIGAAKVALEDRAGAIAAFEAAGKSSDQTLRHTALLRAAYLAAEEEPWQQIQTRLEPVLREEGPFRLLALELVGVMAFDAGEVDTARTTFQQIADAENAPPGLQLRVDRWLDVVGPAPEAAPPSPTPASPATGESK
jgi:hypothetical protein